MDTISCMILLTAVLAFMDTILLLLHTIFRVLSFIVVRIKTGSCDIVTFYELRKHIRHALFLSFCAALCNATLFAYLTLVQLGVGVVLCICKYFDGQEEVPYDRWDRVI